jgi:CheY-like chemotaxis protein
MSTIYAFISDFMFIARIDSVAANLGLEVVYIETAAGIGSIEALPDPNRPGEALGGQMGALVRRVAEEQPGLLLFDLNASAIPWREWIATLKTSSATRRIPILAFGSHMDVETMTVAKDVGADQVLARSRFTTELPALIKKHLRVQNTSDAAAACEGALSELGLAGIALFNQGEYFEAHEVLEDAWNEDQSAARELYRAILQVAVAYLQIERGNYRGAVKMFLRVRQWFEPLPDICRGVNIAGLRADSALVEEEVLRLGEADIVSFDRALFRKVVIVR